MKPPPIVALHIWGIGHRHLPQALGLITRHRLGLRPVSGLRFAKLVATTADDTSGRRKTDLRHWAIITCWNEPADLRVFDHTAIVDDWDKISFERARFVLKPIYSRGSWARQNPFEPVAVTTIPGPVATLTRAQLRIGATRKFQQPLSAARVTCEQADSKLFALAFSDGLIGRFGCFTVWKNSAQSAAGQPVGSGLKPDRSEAIDTAEQPIRYVERIQARFAVVSTGGQYRHRAVPRIG